MKKSTKIILIAAVVLLLVGGIMALICLAMGASWDDAGIELHNPLKWEDHGHEGNHMDIADALDIMGDAETMDFSGEEIHSLDLEIDAGELYIKTGDNYQVSVANGRDNMKCEVRGGVLMVRETDNIQNLFNLGREGDHPVIIVVVPEDTVVETITISVGAGMVDTEILRTKNLDVDVDAGSFVCRELYVEGHCGIEVDAGAASILGGHIEGGLQTEVDAGMFSYCGQITGDWDVDCAMGNIEMTLTGAEEDYNYQIECDMGKVTLGHEEFTGLSTEKQYDHGADHDAQVSCDMGSIDITFTH